MPAHALATVTADTLNLRSGPGTEHGVIALLRAGDELRVTAAVGAWYSVQTARGDGFVHSDFVQLAPGEVVAPPAPSDASPPATYVVAAGDSLSAIGLRLGVDWRVIAAANSLAPPYVIHLGQPLHIPGARPRLGELDVLDPLAAAGGAVLTASSANGHHCPWGGDHAADLDVPNIASPGCEVRFAVALPGGQVRGVVIDLRPACRSLRSEDGGFQLALRLECRSSDVEPWLDAGAWLRYAHLDPVLVAPGQVVEPGATLGLLGPPGGGEYDSSCARGSHVHVEASGATWIANAWTAPGAGPVIRIRV
jgi:LysM repeat protein